MLGLSLTVTEDAEGSKPPRWNRTFSRGQVWFCQGCPGIESLHITSAEALAIMFAVDKAGESSVGVGGKKGMSSSRHIM